MENMRNFQIRKYFISIEQSYRLATWGTKNPNEKMKISPIIADDKLRVSELQLIEQAVSEKKKWLLEKFLQENNILFKDIITDLQNRLNRPSESGKEYIRRLLSDLQNNTENQKSIPTIQRDDFKNTQDPELIGKKWKIMPLPKNATWMRANGAPSDYPKKLAEAQKRYHELETIIKNSNYNAIKNSMYSSMTEISNSSYDTNTELRKFFKNNPHVHKAIIEQEKILQNFGIDIFDSRLTRKKTTSPWNTQKNQPSTNYNDGNWHNHPNIDNIQIRRSGKLQQAVSDTINIHQSGENNQTQYINSIVID